MHTSVSQKDPGLLWQQSGTWGLLLRSLKFHLSRRDNTPHFSLRSKGKHSEPTPALCLAPGESLCGRGGGTKERKAPNWGVGGSGCRIPRVSGLALGTPKQAGHWVLERYPYSALIL